MPITAVALFRGSGFSRTFAPTTINEKVTTMAKVYVNGDAQEVSLPLSLTELIRLSDVQQPEMVSVQVNEEFAERNEWDNIQIKENDKVDYLYFMGGGTIM